MKYVLRRGHEVSPPGPICGGVFGISATDS